MNLYLIRTRTATYATNGENVNQAEKKFEEVYEDREILETKMIPVESLVSMQDNDSIIFF